MNGNDDLLDDILPMVIHGILDPRYVTGKDDPDKKPEKDENGDSGEENKDS